MRNNLLSICLVILHAASVAVVFTGVKYLAQSFRSVEVVFLYKSMLFICVLPWVLRRGISVIITDKTGLLILRGTLTSVASLSFMYALQHVNMVNATALGYLEQILWVFIGVVFFHEQLTKAKIIAIFTSLSGAFLVLFPNILVANSEQGMEFNFYYLFVFIAVLCWGTNAGVIKKIGKTIRADVQLLYSMFFGCVISFCIAIFQWKTFNFGMVSIMLPGCVKGIEPTLLEWHNFRYIILVTAAYFSHSIAFFFAVRRADFSLIMPYDYFRLIFIGILNYLVFSEMEGLLSWIGYCLIVVSGLTIVYSQVKKNKATNDNEG